MLGLHSGLSEVLWIFSRFDDENKRLPLKKNPHFYKTLPTSPEAYGVEFQMDPIETFQHERINVLFDNLGHAGRVFLETAGRTRVFGNVWALNDAIIFKGSCLLCFLTLTDTLLDICGTLEGESIVGEAIQGIPNLWCFEEPPMSRQVASQPALSPNQNGPSLTVIATQITSADGTVILDWREPIRRMLESRYVNIRITDKPLGSSSSVY
jgi:hypothetical protein